MEKRGDVGNLIVRHPEPWHAAIGAPVLHDRSDQLAVLIVEHDRRAQQARSAIAAARVGTVAEGAVRAVRCASSLGSDGIAGGAHRVCADSRTTDASSAAAGGRLRLLRARDRREQRECANDRCSTHAHHRLPSVVSGAPSSGRIAAVQS
jgi:hypothetical protein